jgi:hypothetical protein
MPCQKNFGDILRAAGTAPIFGVKIFLGRGLPLPRRGGAFLGVRKIATVAI